MCCLAGIEGRPEWMLGEEPSERMSKAERQRLDFEAERLRWQEERKKGGQTAQKAANVRSLPYNQVWLMQWMLQRCWAHLLTCGLSMTVLCCCP